MNVKIIFTDGTEINAEMNGGSFITEVKPTFPTDMSAVTIQGTDIDDIIYNNAELIECASVDSHYWFAFREVTEDEKLRADVDYLLCLAE